jgi:hypothetical protein
MLEIYRKECQNGVKNGSPKEVTVRLAHPARMVANHSARAASVWTVPECCLPGEVVVADALRGALLVIALVAGATPVPLTPLVKPAPPSVDVARPSTPV